MVNNHWLVVTGTMEFWMTFHIWLGMESSSQLTPSFFRGLASEKQPTSFRNIFENRAGAQSLNLWGQKLFMGIELPLFLYLQTTRSQIPDLHGDGMMGLCQFLVGKSCRIPICSPNIWVNWCPAHIVAMTHVTSHITSFFGGSGSGRLSGVLGIQEFGSILELHNDTQNCSQKVHEDLFVSKQPTGPWFFESVIVMV